VLSNKSMEWSGEEGSEHHLICDHEEGDLEV
jgi:hypothetical protein